MIRRIQVNTKSLLIECVRERHIKEITMGVIILRTVAWTSWQLVLTFIERGELMSLGDTEFEALVRNPNKDKLWLVGYMDLSSNLAFFLKKKIKNKIFKNGLESLECSTDYY